MQQNRETLINELFFTLYLNTHTKIINKKMRKIFVINLNIIVNSGYFSIHGISAYDIRHYNKY